jgi:hypothetical protein
MGGKDDPTLKTTDTLEPKSKPRQVESTGNGKVVALPPINKPKPKFDLKPESMIDFDFGLDLDIDANSLYLP